MKNENNWLFEYRKDITSQCGEDGIITKILEVLDIKTGWCVDVGAYGMSRSNTYSLVSNGWNGIMIDYDVGIRRLKRTYRNFNNVWIYRKKVEVSGVNSLDSILRATQVPIDFGLLSIDIDGNDFWVWKSLIQYKSQIVVIEINPVCGIQPYVQPIDGNGGASLASLVTLGKVKGYELVSVTELNALFVKKELFYKFNINNNSPEELFVKSDSLYGKDSKNYAKT